MLSRPLLLPLPWLFRRPAFFASPAWAQSVPPYIAAAVSDQARPDADTKRDADRKPAESIAFAGVKPGDKVLELLAFGGYYTRLLARTVGPRGHVYSTMPDALMLSRPAMGDALKAIAADPAYGNVSMLPEPNGTPTAPELVDVVWTSDNYHDLHNPGPFGASDIAGFNKAVFAALKHGGTFIVIDHAGAPGTGLTQTGTLHRVEVDGGEERNAGGGLHFCRRQQRVAPGEGRFHGPLHRHRRAVHLEVPKAVAHGLAPALPARMVVRMMLFHRHIGNRLAQRGVFLLQVGGVLFLPAFRPMAFDRPRHQKRRHQQDTDHQKLRHAQFPSRSTSRMANVTHGEHGTTRTRGGLDLHGPAARIICWKRNGGRKIPDPPSDTALTHTKGVSFRLRP